MFILLSAFLYLKYEQDSKNTSGDSVNLEFVRQFDTGQAWVQDSGDQLRNQNLNMALDRKKTKLQNTTRQVYWERTEATQGIYT